MQFKRSKNNLVGYSFAVYPGWVMKSTHLAQYEALIDEYDYYCELCDSINAKCRSGEISESERLEGVSNAIAGYREAEKKLIKLYAKFKLPYYEVVPDLKGQ